MKLYMFRTVRLSVISSLFTVHSAMVHVIQVCRQLSSRMLSCSKAVYKPVWYVPLLSVQWINSWWRKDKLSETRRVSWQNKFVKLVHLVGFITKKRCYDAQSHVTMHSHMSRRTVTCNDARSHERKIQYQQLHWEWLCYVLVSTAFWTYKLNMCSKNRITLLNVNRSANTFNHLQQLAI